MPLKQKKNTLPLKRTINQNFMSNEYSVGWFWSTRTELLLNSFMIASKGLFYYLGVTAHCPSGMNKSTLGCYFIKLTLQSSMSNINRYQTMLRSLRFNVIFYCDQSWRDNVKKMELFCGRQPIGERIAWRCLSWINV